MSSRFVLNGCCISKQWKENVRYAVCQALAATLATGISWLDIMQEFTAATFLIGIIALLASKQTTGATLATCITVFSGAVYGLIIAWIVCELIGPGAEFVNGAFLFVFVFVLELADSSPQRCKLAQLMGAVVFILYGSSVLSDQVDTLDADLVSRSTVSQRGELRLLAPKVAASVVLSLLAAMIVALLFAKRAFHAASLKVDVTANATLGTVRLLCGAIVCADPDANRVAVLQSSRQRVGIRKLLLRATELLDEARYEWCCRTGVDELERRLDCLNQLLPTLLAMERAVLSDINDKVKAAFANELQPAFNKTRKSIRSLIAGISEQNTKQLQNSMDDIVTAFDQFRSRLYEHEIARHTMHSLFGLHFFVFHLVDALNRMCRVCDGGVWHRHLDTWDDFESVESLSELDLLDVGGIDVELGQKQQPQKSLKTPLQTKIKQFVIDKYNIAYNRLKKRGWFAFQMAASTLVCALFSLVHALRDPYGLWAVVTVILIVNRGFGTSFKKSLSRIQGTASGAVFAFLSLSWLGVRSWPLLAFVFLWVLVLGFMRAAADPTNAYGAFVAAFTPILLFSSILSQDEETHDGHFSEITLARIKFTFIGVFVGLLFSIIPPPPDYGALFQRKANQCLRHSAVAMNAIVRLSGTVDDRWSVDECQELLERVRPDECAEALIGHENEPLLWRQQVAIAEGKKLVDKLICIKRRLSWMLAAAQPLTHNVATRAYLLTLVVAPVESTINHTLDVAAELLDTLALGLRTSANVATMSRILVRLRKCEQTLMRRSTEQIENNVRSNVKRVSTVDTLGYASFAFAFSDLLKELRNTSDTLHSLVIATTVARTGHLPRLQKINAHE